MQIVKPRTYIVLIPCAGHGARFLSDVPKQYLPLANKTVLEYTLLAFLAVEQISQIVLVVAPHDQYAKDYARLSKKITIHYCGGATRAASVFNGLTTLKCQDDAWIMVHDAVRCLITPQRIKHMITELANDEVGGIFAIPTSDSLKMVENNVISRAIKRDNIYLAQTPQMFRYHVLLRALSQVALALNPAAANGLPSNITDEASSVEQLGLMVQVIPGDVRNIKITYPEDLALAAAVLCNPQ